MADLDTAQELLQKLNVSSALSNIIYIFKYSDTDQATVESTGRLNARLELSSKVHFIDIIADCTYQAANLKYRLLALRDTCILIATVVLPLVKWVYGYQ